MVKPLSVLIAKLKKVEKIVEELPSVVSDALRKTKEKSFRAEGYAGDANIKKWKERKIPDPTRRMLVLTGRLRSSIFSSFNKRHKTASIKTNVPYAKKHNVGEGKIPQRQYIPDGGQKGPGVIVEKELKKEIEKIIKISKP